MGKIQVLDEEQNGILAEVATNSFFDEFYFTGGTALSAFYLNHRYSEDLDFFTEKEFNSEALFTLVDSWRKKCGFTFTSEFHQVVHIFMLTFQNGRVLKVDFGYYPYPRIEQSQIVNNIKTDSLVDIAVNKLLTITQRTTIKDFVDLYYLLQEFTIWDLIQGVRVKFRVDLEPFILASDLLKVDDFDQLPRMIRPLKLEELKAFFRQKAREMGLKAVA